MSAPLIVTVELAAADMAWLDALRRRHFPPERNQLAAHCTMFHAIPAMLEEELRQRLAGLAADLPPPRTMLAGLMDLGAGVTATSPATAPRWPNSIAILSRVRSASRDSPITITKAGRGGSGGVIRSAAFRGEPILARAPTRPPI